MPRNQTNSAFKFVGAAAAAIVGGVTIGYLFGGARPEPPVEQVTPPASVAVTSPTPPVAPSTIRPHLTNGNYTAPDAPRIVIREESEPHMRRVDQTVPALKPSDSEASQEAVPPVKVSPPTKVAPSEKADDTPNNVTAPPADSTISTPATPDNSTPSPNPSPSPSPIPPSAAPSSPSGSPTTPDPDFERVNKHGDAQSGQAGSAKAQFRVQTGAYTDESNARSVADELRGQGYDTSTRSERDGSHLVYKVQVGAYRSRSGAGKAADDLQKQGYPAYVSPITP